MDDTLETFVPLTFRRRGARRRLVPEMFLLHNSILKKVRMRA